FWQNNAQSLEGKSAEYWKKLGTIGIVPVDSQASLKIRPDFNGQDILDFATSMEAKGLRHKKYITIEMHSNPHSKMWPMQNFDATIRKFLKNTLYQIVIVTDCLSKDRKQAHVGRGEMPVPTKDVQQFLQKWSIASNRVHVYNKASVMSKSFLYTNRALVIGS